MSAEPTERDRALARAVVNSDWFAEQLAEARREGAVEAMKRVVWLPDAWERGPHRSAEDCADELRAEIHRLRGDGFPLELDEHFREIAARRPTGTFPKEES